MFALTPRLVLRPGWPEEAPELAAAINHYDVVRRLSRVPWPYGLADAEGFLALPCSAETPRFQIYDRTDGHRLIGGIGIDMDGPYGGPEFGYWLTPSAWNRGYMTEAGRAVVAIARDTLRLPQLQSGHWVDNPASGAVLRKLGFVPTGVVELRPCLAEKKDQPCATYTLALAPAARIAA